MMPLVDFMLFNVIRLVIVTFFCANITKGIVKDVSHLKFIITIQIEKHYWIKFDQS